MKTRWQNGAAAVGFAGQILARLAAVGREILRPASFGGGALHGPARVGCGWSEVPPLVRSSTARRWLLGLNDVPSLESFLLGFSLGITSYVYIGSRVIFG